MNYKSLDSYDRSIIMELSQFKSFLNAPGRNHTTTTITATSTNYNNLGNSFMNPVYVEWYWVALGLIVPVLLGSLFCVLDHMRRKKGRSPRHTEQRLESMCERNKYVPPKYEEIIPNNRIIIEPVPVHEHSTASQQIFTVESETASATSYEHLIEHEVAVAAAPHILTVAASSTDNHSIDSSTNLNLDYTGLQMPSIKQYASSMDKPDFDNTDDATEGPPSYDEYHKYELYGSRVELV